MPRKKTIPTEPLPNPLAEITEAAMEPTPNPIEQPPPDILAGSAPPGEDLEIPSMPSETDAEAEVSSTEASEDAEEPSSDDADMTVDFAEDSAAREGSPPNPETTAEVEVAVVEEDASPPMAEAPPAEEQEPPAPKPEMSDREKFFHLDFHKLDRNLSEEERREWNAIYASYRGGSPLSGTVIGVDMFSLNVRSRRTGEVRKRELSCAIVVPYRVRILIPETEMWSGAGRPGMSLNHIMGATLSFNIIKVDRENGFTLASRKSAMKARRSYFAHRAELNALGTRLKCRVIDVGPVRCTVECYGHDIRLTQKDLCYMSVSDLRAVYRPGQELDCVVTDYDADADRLRISVKAALSDPFEGAERRHPVNSRRQAVISGKYAGGVFCNLPDGTVCMCSYAYQYEDSDFEIGDTVILTVKRFDSNKRQMYGKILSKW